MTGTILVVGAAGGVGLAVTALLLKKGYSVIGTVRDKGEADAARASCPGISDLITMDFADADAVLAVLDSALNKHEIDLRGAIVCVGVSPPGPLEIMPLAQLRRTLEVNVVSDLAVYQKCLPLLRKSKGRLILISSFTGKLAFPFLGSYVASKHALEGMCDVMRQEARKWGVDVILFEPGAIKTALVHTTIAQVNRDEAALKPGERDLYGEQYRQFRAICQAALNEGMEPPDVAKSIVDVLETASPDARYPLGGDAQQLIEQRRNSTDRQMDEMFATMYAAAGR